MRAHAQGRRAGMGAVVLKPLWTFVRDYLLRGGFRDGKAGYILCRMNAHYTFMKYTTLTEMQDKPTQPPAGDKQHNSSCPK